MKKFLLIGLLIVLVGGFVFFFMGKKDAETKESNFPVEFPKGCAQTYILQVVQPQNANDKTHVSIDIPSNFKSVRPVTDFQQEPMKEFVLEHESVEAWSELITVLNFLYKGPDLGKNTFSHLKQAAFENGGTVLKEVSFDNTVFDNAMMIMAYNSHNRREVMGAIYFCGPSDYVMLQYAVALKEGETEEDAAKRVGNFLLAHSRTFALSENQLKQIPS